MARPLCARWFALLVILALAACDGSSPTYSSGSARLAVRMTDAPVAGASAVNVHITGLVVKRSGSPVERIAGDLGVVELLALDGTSALLVTAQVEPGTYEFIQVELDPDGSTVVEEGSGDIFPLAIASREIKVLGGFTLQEDGTTTVLLDFDAAASLRLLGNDDWLLTPVISLANVSVG